MQTTDCYQANARPSFCEVIGLHLPQPAIMLVSFLLTFRLKACILRLYDLYSLLLTFFQQNSRLQIMNQVHMTRHIAEWNVVHELCWQPN